MKNAMMLAAAAVMAAGAAWAGDFALPAPSEVLSNALQESGSVPGIQQASWISPDYGPVATSPKARAGESEVKGAVPEELLKTLSNLDGKTLRLVEAVHSAADREFPRGSVCQARTQVYFASGERPYLGYLMNEDESVFLKAEGLGVGFPLGVAVTRSVVKIFRGSGEGRYRVYSSYWARIASPVMIAAANYTNELEVWKEGGRLQLKQKHQFSANGVDDRSKECLFDAD